MNNLREIGRLRDFSVVSRYGIRFKAKKIGESEKILLISVFAA